MSPIISVGSQYMLEKLFDFSDDDLQANTEGHLTEYQLNRLKRYRRNHQYSWGIASVIGLSMLVVLFPPMSGASSDFYGVYLVLFVIFAIMEYLCVVEYRAIQSEIQIAAPAMVAGHAKMGPYGRVYGLYVADKTFGLMPKRYEALVRENVFPPEGQIQVYYAPHTKIVLSIKHID